MKIADLALVGTFFVIAAIALSVGGDILLNIADAEMDTITATQAVSITSRTGTLNKTAFGQITSCANIATYLAHTVPTQCNVTLNGNRGNVINSDNATAHTVNVTYDHIDMGDWTYLTGENTTGSTSAFARWLPTIALVVAAAVIIGVIFSARIGEMGGSI